MLQLILLHPSPPLMKSPSNGVSWSSIDPALRSDSGDTNFGDAWSRGCWRSAVSDLTFAGSACWTVCGQLFYELARLRRIQGVDVFPEPACCDSYSRQISIGCRYEQRGVKLPVLTVSRCTVNTRDAAPQGLLLSIMHPQRALKMTETSSNRVFGLLP